MQKGCLIVVLLVVGLLAFLGITAMSSYNGLVTRQERIQASASQIDNQYQRRFDLVPQLVETVKGVAGFEQSTLMEVTEARASVGRMTLPADVLKDGDSVNKYMAAQGQLGSALGRLFAVSEAYPQLRATDSFRDLQAQLEGTENRIAVARADFIEAVRQYNTGRRTFPANLLAATFNFEEAEVLEGDPAAREVPVIDFSNDG